MLRIGEFSKLCNLSIRMLRHYDEIGLLNPTKIDVNTGFRYYSYDQLLKISKIQEFKSMGISLKEIKYLLSIDDNNDSLKDYLNNHRQNLINELEEVNRKMLFTENTLNNMNNEVKVKKYHIVVKVIKKRYVASIRKKIDYYTDESKLWDLLNSEMKSQKIVFNNPPMNISIYHDKEYKEYNPDVEIQTSVIGKYKDTDYVVFKTLDSVKVASVFLKGPFEKISDVNIKVIDWLKNNNYVISGNMFSIYHISPHIESNPKNFLTEICYPIKDYNCI